MNIMKYMPHIQGHLYQADVLLIPISVNLNMDIVNCTYLS